MYHSSNFPNRFMGSSQASSGVRPLLAADNSCPASPPAVAEEKATCPLKSNGSKLRPRRWRSLGPPEKRRFCKRAKRCRRRLLQCRQVRRSRAFDKHGQQLSPTECASQEARPIRGILRASPAPRPTPAACRLASRRNAWFRLPRLFTGQARSPRKLTRSPLTFNMSVETTVFTRSLGDGVPSEGDIAIGLGRPLRTMQTCLAAEPKEPTSDLPVVLAEFRADLVKESISPAHFVQVLEAHQSDTACIRQSRRDSVKEGKDMDAMSSSLQEAQQRALKLSAEAADATEEVATPPKREVEAYLQNRPWKRIVFQETWDGMI